MENGVGQSTSQNGSCCNCGKASHIDRNCTNPEVETCARNRCGMKGHSASQCKVNVSEVAAEEDGDNAILGAVVIDEVQDLDIAGREHIKDTRGEGEAGSVLCYQKRKSS